MPAIQIQMKQLFITLSALINEILLVFYLELVFRSTLLTDT